MFRGRTLVFVLLLWIALTVRNSWAFSSEEMDYPAEDNSEFKEATTVQSYDELVWCPTNRKTYQEIFKSFLYKWDENTKYTVSIAVIQFASTSILLIIGFYQLKWHKIMTPGIFGHMLIMAIFIGYNVYALLSR
ncbi:uncharacterized protein LOC142237474 [Haematobia irritans]|uniref:uncharacterized protein LOC142237474 n=1 Tax=Haematobia irritans TaxID=7368 RepID=UPI003F4F6AE6